MSTTTFPTVAAYPLPTDDLRTPLKPRPAPSIDARQAAQPDPSALSEAMAPAISAAIARRAKQRRYTP